MNKKNTPQTHLERCRIPVKILFDESLDIESIRLYSVMKTKVNEGELFLESDEFLSKNAQLSLEALEKKLKALADAGYIRVLYDGNGHRVYVEILHLNLPILIKLEKLPN